MSVMKKIKQDNEMGSKSGDEVILRVREDIFEELIFGL